jgi:hypothetical protein
LGVSPFLPEFSALFDMALSSFFFFSVDDRD